MYFVPLLLLCKYSNRLLIVEDNLQYTTENNFLKKILFYKNDENVDFFAIEMYILTSNI